MKTLMRFAQVRFVIIAVAHGPLLSLRLMREYESRRASEGDLTEQDMPAELLADVEANQNEDDR